MAEKRPDETVTQFTVRLIRNEVIEECARAAEAFYENPDLEPHLRPALEIGKVCGKQIAEAIRRRAAVGSPATPAVKP
jgi:hypothetical protein